MEDIAKKTIKKEVKAQLKKILVKDTSDIPEDIPVKKPTKKVTLPPKRGKTESNVIEVEDDGKKKPKKVAIKKISTKQITDEESDTESISDIATREDLKEKIHELHNFLRNNGIGYGMNSLKVFNLFYGLKRIEQYNLFDKIDLNPECKFSTLLSMAADENKHDELFEVIPQFQMMLKSSKAEKFVLFGIPTNVKGSVIARLIIETDRLVNAETRINEQLSGKLYEYFVGRDKSAISELGAYFTNRGLIKYIYDYIYQPQINEDGTIQSMIDPFGGSGGFTIGYIMRIMEESKSNPNFKWSENVSKIFHIDMNADVVKYAGLEVMCLTQSIPNMNTNLRCANSFTFEFPEQYDCVATNPPYGGDKNVKSASYRTREKIRKFITDRIETLDEDSDEIEKLQEQLEMLRIHDKKETALLDATKVSVDNSSDFIRTYASDHDLTGNDKEATSLILMAALLKENGVAVGVLKEGVFFDKKYSNLRKHILENFNVISITSVAANQFENTITKTSIIRFDNTEEKTSYVEFYEIDMIKYEEDIFEIDENGYVNLKNMKDEVKTMSPKYISRASVEELAENTYILQGSKYVKDLTVTPSKNYKLMKIDDLCVIKSDGKRKSEEGKEIGKYPLYYCSILGYKYLDDYDYDSNQLIINKTNGKCKAMIYYANGKHSVAKSTLILSQKEKANLSYLYAYLLNNIPMIEGCFRGSTQGQLYVDMFKEIQIPIPKTQKLLDAWETKLKTVLLKKQECEFKIIELKEEIKLALSTMLESKEYTEQPLEDLCQIKDGFKFGIKDHAKPNKYVEGKTLPLIQNGKQIKNYIPIKEKYSNFITNKGDILISSQGTIVIKRMIYSSAYHRMNIFKLISITENIEYIYYYLNHTIDDIVKLSKGSIVKNLNMPIIRTIPIRIPNDKTIIEKINEIGLSITNLQDMYQQAEDEFNTLSEQLIKESQKH